MLASVEPGHWPAIFAHWQGAPPRRIIHGTGCAIGPQERRRRSSLQPLSSEAGPELAQLAERSMQLQATIQEGAITLSSKLGSVVVEPVRWK